MAMILSPKTKIDELLKGYPFLEDFLLGRSPKFRFLKNPIVRGTVGRLATLAQMAAIGGIDLRDFQEEIAAKIKRERGEEITVEHRTSEDTHRPLTDPDLRQEVLRDIMRDLHGGLDIQVLRKRFADLIGSADPAEIARVEQGLLEEDMTESELKDLRDISRDLFQGSSTAHHPAAPELHGGPVADTSGSASAAPIPLDTGSLTPDQINLILTSLPLDLTFVNERDEVVYYSQTRKLLFPRNPGIIGLSVQDCHSPKSLGMVQEILDEFRAGRKDVAEFWVQMKGRFIHIRYFAIRDAAGAYRGTLEMSQDVTGIRTLEGERKALDWD